MTEYQDDIDAIWARKEENGSSWHAIDPEAVARMRAQNRFRTGLEIAQYTADIMRADMAEYCAPMAVMVASSSNGLSAARRLKDWINTISVAGSLAAASSWQAAFTLPAS